MRRSGLAGIALAAGKGTRLGELTQRIPKPLLKVGGVALLDLALDRLAAVTTDIAVNAHHLGDQIAAHVDGRAHVSLEDELLGTAGALAKLRGWIGGRDVAVTNADAWLRLNPLPDLVSGWSGRTVRLSGVHDPAHPDFEGGLRYSGCCLLPGRVVETIPDGPAGLYESVWAPRLGTNELELVEHEGQFFDCGTPSELAAAQAVASGESADRP